MSLSRYSTIHRTSFSNQNSQDKQLCVPKRLHAITQHLFMPYGSSIFGAKMLKMLKNSNLRDGLMNKEI